MTNPPPPAVVHASLDRRAIALPAAIVALLLAALIIYLRLSDRVWWCGCGGWIPWSAATGSRHNSQHLIDPYSTSHVLHGLLFFFATRLTFRRLSVAWRLAISVLIEVGWEALENSPFIIDRYRAGTAAIGYVGDSIANSLSDVACAAIGFAIARCVGWRWSLAIFVVTELTMLWWIRDGLTLNVIMLVYPLDTIRRWQLA